MKVLLIWPFNAQGVEIRELFPIGLGYLLANIDYGRYDVKILDCTLDRIRPESRELASRLAAFRPDVVGISFWSSNADSVYRTVRAIRDVVPGAKIVFGGPHATSYGEYEIRSRRADFVIAGEGERSFPMLLDAIADDSVKGFSTIPGLVYMGRDGTVVSNPVVFEKDLDTLGYVDYKVLRLEDYHKAGYSYSGSAVLHSNLRTALILATRGCAYRCRFCSAPIISGRRIRFHSPGYIARTIKNLYEEFNVRVISMGDDNFTLKQDYAMALCRAVIDLNLEDLIMAAPNGIRMTRMTPELARLMRRAGFEEVTIAPESGSPRTLELMHKDMELEKVEPFVRMCHNAGLKVKANFIIGYPGETMEDVLLTERFIKDNDFDQIGLCFFQPLPGTPIFNELVAKGEIDESFVPGRYNQLTYCPQGMDKEDLCMVFNRIMNDFRDSKGWRYKNGRVGTIRQYKSTGTDDLP